MDLEPVTPLFESWLLSRMENSLHQQLQRWTGQGAPRPHHVVVNGWYFYSINWLSLGASIRNGPALVWHIIREPRRVAAMIPPTVRYGIALFEREWREDLQPRYRLAIAAAARSVEVTPPSQLPMLVDDLADLAGEYFASVAALSGAAYKMEMNLAIFYRRHIARAIGGSHLPLVAGFESRRGPSTGDRVNGLVVRPGTLARAHLAPAPDHQRVVEARLGPKRPHSGPGRVAAPPPRVSTAVGRDPAPGANPRGTGRGADDRVAGDAASRRPHRRGARLARRSGEQR